MNIVKVRDARVQITKRIELSQEHLRQLILATIGTIIPSEASMFIKVPGGGDWSNTLLDISEDNPVIITWVELHEEQS